MKQTIEQLKQALPKIFIFILVTLLFFIPTVISWIFIYIETGKFVGPYLGLFLTSSIVLCILICPHFTIYRILLKLKKNITKRMILISLIIALLLMFSLSMLFMQQVLKAEQKIDRFIAENKNMDFHDYIANLSYFLDNNVQKAYRKPESLFRVDNYIYSTCFGAYITQHWGVSRADIVDKTSLLQKHRPPMGRSKIQRNMANHRPMVYRQLRRSPQPKKHKARVSKRNRRNSPIYEWVFN